MSQSRMSISHINPIAIVVVIVAVMMAIGMALLFFATKSDAPAGAAPAPEASASASPSAAGTPTAAPNPSAVTSSEASTSLNIAVANCENCQITAQPTSGATDLQPLSATVADGMAQIDVPTSTTLGMVFSVRGEQDGVDLTNDKLVILAGQGITAGAEQSESAVTEAGNGQYCWAGTTLDVATLRFAVSGSNESPQAAWADPALATTKKGTVKIQSAGTGVPENLDCGN